MDVHDIRRKFPSLFPVDLLPVGAREERIEVYRICRMGNVNAESFLPTYLDEIARTKGTDSSDISYYSLSTFEKEGDARRILKFFLGKNPKAIAAKGITDESCGPVQRTRERTGEKRARSHVDWWLYEGAKPHIFFREVDM